MASTHMDREHPKETNKRSHLNISAETQKRLESLFFDIYSDSNWKHAIAGLLLNAADFAINSKPVAAGATAGQSYHDIPLKLSDGFEISDLKRMVPCFKTSLYSILDCMNYHSCKRKAPMPLEAKSKRPVIVSIHGYVPPEANTECPHVPHTEQVLHDMSALVVACALKGELLGVVPCYQGWPLLSRHLWNSRLVFIQVAYVSARNTESESADSKHIECTTDVQVEHSSKHTEPIAIIPQELKELYTVFNAITSRGVRSKCDETDRFVYTVPSNIPQLTCLHCVSCPEEPYSAVLQRLQHTGEQIKADELTHMECTPEKFLGCAHCSFEHQIETLAAWEKKVMKVVLEHDIESIRKHHTEFLKSYNIADPSRDSFEHVTEPADIEKNCEALRNCACWQRGKHASYPGHTFVLVDVPLKGEDLSASRRVKKGSSAPPWNKVVANMTVPSESMVQKDCRTPKCLQGDCTLFKVPYNAGIDAHTLHIRNKVRVRNKGGKNKKSSVSEENN